MCFGCEWGVGGRLRMRKLKEGPAINKAHSSTRRAGDGRGGVGALALPHHVHTRNTHTHTNKRTLSCISATRHSPHKAFDKL